MIFGTNLKKKSIHPVENIKKWASLVNPSHSNESKYQFSAKIDNCDFLDQICQKRGSCFQCKIDKIDTTIEFCIFEVVLYQISIWVNNFECLDQICPRKMVKNRKIKHHHWILHIQISLGTKFQWKLTILIFLTRFTQKRFFWSKIEKVNPSYFLHNSAYSN